jgi:hypothetical protein
MHIHMYTHIEPYQCLSQYSERARSALGGRARLALGQARARPSPY